MPTPKQVRFHYKRIRRRLYMLQNALNAAHNADVIVYDGYSNGPCCALDMVRVRIEETTKDTRATAFREECMDELKKVW